MFKIRGGRALKSTLREQVHPGVSDPKSISSTSGINSEPALRISDKSTSVPYQCLKVLIPVLVSNNGPRTYDNGPSIDSNLCPKICESMPKNKFVLRQKFSLNDQEIFTKVTRH